MTLSCPFLDCTPSWFSLHTAYKLESPKSSLTPAGSAFYVPKHTYFLSPLLSLLSGLVSFLQPHCMFLSLCCCLESHFSSICYCSSPSSDHVLNGTWCYPSPGTFCTASQLFHSRQISQVQFAVILLVCLSPTKAHQSWCLAQYGHKSRAPWMNANCTGLTR